ncbi:hypothetical protein K0U91_07565 [Chryseobacterium chendengshani]|uniref:hypothetical protein n=1 Tax=Chryseobacterium sp. LJ668 TaxID=2864040 RepID=UPI001C6911EF|nr:hypothetical protein [Chryseobacterium sp. LJ668]MBW8522327.1 hypothetical protein [Chryseobacterium sp. LJ668]QYK17966.1 hypothetical protein K0U91_07565 [Chryseobacterium sp. LJ668]
MKIQWRLAFLVVLSVLIYLTVSNYKNRVYDWDMPGYLACLYELEFPNSAEKVHQLTYSSIKKEASPLQYKDISGLVIPNKAIQFFEKNPKGLSEQIPYYKIKVGYNLVILGLYKSGFSGPHSVLLVSCIFYFLSGLLLFYILQQIFPQNYIIASVSTLVIVLLPTAKFMAKTPSPDMLGFLFLLLFVLALFKKWNQWIVFLILLLTILIRPDYIIFALTYLLTVIFFRFIKENKKFDFNLVFQGILLTGIYIFILKYYSYPGWKDLFYDTFIERRPLISAQQANFSLHAYLEILFNKFIYFKKVSVSALLIFIFIFYFSKDFYVRLISFFLFANIYIKFLIFPDSASVRFFFGFIILLFLMLLYALSKKYNGFQLNKIA